MFDSNARTAMKNTRIDLGGAVFMIVLLFVNCASYEAVHASQIQRLNYDGLDIFFCKVLIIIDFDMEGSGSE